MDAHHDQKKAIVIGASSGIGKTLVEVLADNGYVIGLASRRKELLIKIQQSLPTQSFVKQIDVSETETARILLDELITEMNGVDLIIINAGIGFINPNLEWEKEKETIQVNVTGFCAMATKSMNYFLNKGSGHLVGISSISAIKGIARAPAYGASKAFVSHYLASLRNLAFKKKKPIIITTIEPGFVETEMVKKTAQRFWVSTSREAALQIYQAIKKKKSHAYITKRWRLIAWIMQIAPNWIYRRF